MYSLDRLRRENLAIQTAIRNRLLEIRNSQQRSTSTAIDAHRTGNEIGSNLQLTPQSFLASGVGAAQLSTSEVVTLLNLRSQNALQQQLQNQQLALIRATLPATHLGVPAAANTDACNDVRASFLQTLSNQMNGSNRNTINPNSSRLLQLANVIDSSLAHGTHLGDLATRLDLRSSLQPSGSKQTGLTTIANSAKNQSKVLAKARAASFAPVRKKSKDSKASPFAMNQEDDSTKTPILKEQDDANHEKKPSKNFTKWQAMLETLKKFKETHGHCIVPRGFEDIKLASWVVEQRKQFRRYQENLPCGIDSKRINCLNEIGFTWDAQEAAWDRQMDHLREFHRIHGHCDVSRDDVQFPKLYLWMREQRRHYKLMKQGQASLLTKARIDALKSVCFSFDTLGAIFTSRLQDLTEFRCRHGHCHVPPGYTTKANCKLFGWTQRLKKEYKAKMRGQKSTLSEAHIKALNELEFPWLSGKPEEIGPVARRSSDDADDSTLSSSSEDGNDSVASVETGSSSVEQSSVSTLEGDNMCGRPLKKRRIL